MAPRDPNDSAIKAYSNKSMSERQQMVLEYAPLVKRIALFIKGRLPANIDLNDLIQNGMLGLIDAVNNFVDGKGASFKSYAALRIRGSIIDGLRRSDWAPRTVHVNARIITEARERLSQILGREPSDYEIAKDVGVDINDLHLIMVDTNQSQVMAVEDTGCTEDFLYELSQSENIPFHDDTLYDGIIAEQFNQDLVKALKNLPDKERYVIGLYYEKHMNVKEISAILGVSSSRICQLMANGFKHIRKDLYLWGKNREGQAPSDEVMVIDGFKVAEEKPKKFRRSSIEDLYADDFAFAYGSDNQLNVDAKDEADSDKMRKIDRIMSEGARPIPKKTAKKPSLLFDEDGEIDVKTEHGRRIVAEREEERRIEQERLAYTIAQVKRKRQEALIAPTARLKKRDANRPFANDKPELEDTPTMIADSKRHALKQSKLAQKEQLDEEFDISQDDLVGAVEANSSEDKDSSSASKSDSESINGIALPSITVPSRSKVKSKREVKISMSDISLPDVGLSDMPNPFAENYAADIEAQTTKAADGKKSSGDSSAANADKRNRLLAPELDPSSPQYDPIKAAFGQMVFEKQQSENIQELIDLNLLDESANKAFKANDQDSNNQDSKDQDSKDQAAVAKKPNFSSIPSDIPEHLLEEIDAMCDQTEPAFVSDFSADLPQVEAPKRDVTLSKEQAQAEFNDIIMRTATIVQLAKAKRQKFMAQKEFAELIFKTIEVVEARKHQRASEMQRKENQLIAMQKKAVAKFVAVSNLTEPDSASHAACAPNYQQGPAQEYLNEIADEAMYAQTLNSSSADDLYSSPSYESEDATNGDLDLVGLKKRQTNRTTRTRRSSTSKVSAKASSDTRNDGTSPKRGRPRAQPIVLSLEEFLAMERERSNKDS
ncbi:RNA polymerase sigma factor FliA [Anaerobiospirillum succiniciproducens]|uniref:RNA polymerase sigma factor FliA n=1 Tax=Anaerobiospirillum succiniciproducens TaxID=13335 RepID=UPI00042578DB|nr:RNA polymerase sigma factor FliA [Anaerobiospirillum succiniciproducens]